MSYLNEKGQEVFDQTPVEITVPFERPLPLHIRIRQQILAAQALISESQEIESPEEADDFSDDDDPEMWNSPYEGDFDHINKPLNEVLPNTSTSATNAESSPHEEAETAEGEKP